MTSPRFAARRAEFLEVLGDTIAIIPAGREQVRNHDVDHPFRQQSDFFFLTGFTEPDAVAVLDPRSDEPYTLFVRPRDPEAEAWTGRRVGVDGALAEIGADAAFEITELGGWLKRNLIGRSRVGYRFGGPHDAAITAAIATARAATTSLGATAPSDIVDVGLLLAEMRLVKSEEEIAALREACRISAVAHAEAMRFAEPGRTERQVQAAIEYVFASMDAERPGYGSIVAGGDNAVILHYVENDAVLRDGDLLLIDAGAEYRHLTADITRTFPINGSFSPPQRAVYDVVLAAHRTVLDMCRPGLGYSDMHTTAVEVLASGMADLGLLPGSADEIVEKGWYRQFYFHGTGHWLGIDVHDAGAYRVDGEGRPLAPGMAFTVEPGLYVAPHKATVQLGHAAYDPEEMLRLRITHGAEHVQQELDRRNEEAGTFAFEVPEEFLGIGVRIEDDVLITDAGHDNLTELVPIDPNRIEDLCAEPTSLPLFTSS